MIGTGIDLLSVGQRDTSRYGYTSPTPTAHLSKTAGRLTGYSHGVAAELSTRSSRNVVWRVRTPVAEQVVASVRTCLECGALVAPVERPLEEARAAPERSRGNGRVAAHVRSSHRRGARDPAAKPRAPRLPAGAMLCAQLSQNSLVESRALLIRHETHESLTALHTTYNH